MYNLSSEEIYYGSPQASTEKVKGENQNQIYTTGVAISRQAYLRISSLDYIQDSMEIEPCGLGTSQQWNTNMDIQWCELMIWGL